MTHPDSRRPTTSSSTFVPQEDCKQFKMGSEPSSSRVRRPPPRAQMKDCCSFHLINFSLNSKPLTYTFLLLIKRVRI